MTHFQWEEHHLLKKAYWVTFKHVICGTSGWKCLPREQSDWLQLFQKVSSLCCSSFFRTLESLEILAGCLLYWHLSSTMRRVPVVFERSFCNFTPLEINQCVLHYTDQMFDAQFMNLEMSSLKYSIRRVGLKIDAKLQKICFVWQELSKCCFFWSQFAKKGAPMRSLQVKELMNNWFIK